MLLNSLQYFWLKFWGASRDDERVRISGEDYWLYRIHLDALIFAVLVLGTLTAAFMAPTPELPAANLFALTGVFAFIGIIDLLWLRIQLREQREFAILFYD